MKMFAEVLTEYLNHNTISYRKVSDAIHIDRTTLRRYVAGERLPKNTGVVKALAKEIGMSEEEERTLVKSYERSRIGEKKYRGYQIIEQIFGGG